MPEEALLGYFLTGGTALFFSHTCLRILPLDNLNAFWGISQLAFLSAFFFSRRSLLLEPSLFSD